MRKCLIGAILCMISISAIGSFNYPGNMQYAAPGQWAQIPWWQTTAGLHTLSCQFETTGDNIPITMNITNFTVVSGGPPYSMVINYPGFTYVAWQGTFNNLAYGYPAYLINKDYDSSYAKAILLYQCSWDRH